MIIDVWSDVVCPWCFIGKRRLEKAVASLPDGTQVEIRHRAFQLQPDIQGVVSTTEHLASKYRLDSEAVARMQANVCSIADGEGLCYDLENTLSGNTRDAHRLLLWAQSQGRHAQLLEAMYSAYFEKSEALFSHEDLIAVATRAGFNKDTIEAVLNSNDFDGQVTEDQQLASNLGATGVPFFVIDMKVGISGAQPQEVFNNALAQALSN
ncbi:DsbA family oxidoreductase [Rhodoluna sp.]|uniref:DsbA family oxidoreductase n=1 Tax=Rhodoluna sp. TaxID=1969481 RepID=UPI0025F3934B|nr:DsbA family oxidoreductase [Rhodoluna sp.]